MDINDLRVAVTLVSFGLFAGIVRWAWTRTNRARFDEAAQLPFINDTADGAPSPPSSLRSLPAEGRLVPFGRPGGPSHE